MNVARDSDDRGPRAFAVESAELDAMADRAFSRPELARHCFVHDCNHGRIGTVAVVEEASGLERHAHRTEIVSGDDSRVRVENFTGAGRGSPFDDESPRAAVVRQRHPGHEILPPQLPEGGPLAREPDRKMPFACPLPHISDRGAARAATIRFRCGSRDRFAGASRNFQSSTWRP